ncbi:9730_t:CDS:2 [Ambispora gerdemannii]|uniref:9730_t:CDS:1 n=1 Tax=Ambispora gerdemannii TaxID=144530 RepID=A0A9N9F2E6_9GLOM|nr:9730_t:CDS:2 [Ambispora gerdemannii]
MVKNQNEFNEKFNDKEIDEIEIKRKKFEGQLIIKDYSKLEEIYLYNVSSIDKITLKDLPQLEKCTIRGCGIKELAIENCSQIKELNVESNLLTSLEFAKNLPNLQRLEVDGNLELASGSEFLPKGLKKFSCDNTKLPSLEQKYETLKGIMTSVTKETQKELVGKLDQEIKEASGQLRTKEIVLNLTKGVAGLKEVKKDLETNLAESEAKIKRLETELAEAKARAEQRQKKIEELSQEHSLEEIEQTPINEKTITFLRAKSIFLNARQETIGELQKCFIDLQKKFGKGKVIGEVSSAISGVGGVLDTVTFGITGAIGEVIKLGSTFSQIVLAEKGNEEFQISLKDEKELIQLHKDYDSLVSFKSGTNILDLRGRTRDGKARAFNTDYEIFSILESKNLGEEKASLFYQEQQIGAKIRRLENQLEGLKNSAKDKLKKRELLLQKFLNNQAALTTSERELLERKITKEELDNICQVQVALTNSQRELAILQEQQAQSAKICDKLEASLNIGKHAKTDEKGKLISAGGNAFSSLTLGIIKALGEAIQSLNSSSKRKLSAKLSAEFQKHLATEEDILKLFAKDYFSLINVIKENKELAISFYIIRYLKLENRLESENLELFASDYETFKSELGKEQNWFEQKSTELQKQERQENLEQNVVSEKAGMP